MRRRLRGRPALGPRRRRPRPQPPALSNRRSSACRATSPCTRLYASLLTVAMLKPDSNACLTSRVYAPQTNLVARPRRPHPSANLTYIVASASASFAICLIPPMEHASSAYRLTDYLPAIVCKAYHKGKDSWPDLYPWQVIALSTSLEHVRCRFCCSCYAACASLRLRS